MEYDDDCGFCRVMACIETVSRQGEREGWSPEQILDRCNGMLFTSVMKDHQLTRSAAAALLGLSEEAVASLESGKTHATTEMLERVALMAGGPGRTLS